jgi:4-amino-4-deoxy-L-arabinose transferase-like glycosyltransferase
MVPKKASYIFFIFIITSVLLRFYSFFPGVIDHDESTYLVIGRELILGKHLYVDVTDTKPVGIFLIFAFFYFVFGYSIFLPRLVVAVMVGFTGWLIHRASFVLAKDRTAAFAAGLIYIFYLSVWSQFGLSPNTEQFFNLTTISAFLFLLKDKRWSFFVAGLLFGLGFIIKYLVLFDFVFLAAFFLIRELNQRKWKLSAIPVLKYILAGVGFALPFFLTNLWFFLGDHFEAFKYITYQLPFKYGRNPDNLKFLVLLLDFLVRFLPVSFMFFYVLISKNRILPKWQVQMFIVWICGIVIAMYLPGKSFDHYTMQLMVPFSLVAGMFFHSGFTSDKYSQLIFGRKYGPALLLAFIVIVQVTGITGIVSEKDRPRQVAAYLREEMSPDDSIYLSNYKQILYYLLHKESPTKYIHPTLLSNPDRARLFGIDGNKEIERIIDSKPTWVVVKNPYPFLLGLIGKDYRAEKSFFQGEVTVYRLQDAP